MRRTLGLEHRAAVSPFRTGERHSQVRRFVRDGEVPVVVVNRRESGGEGVAGAAVNRLALAETALGVEHAERLRCERALLEAQASLRELQTKIGHAILARDEALEGNRLLAAENARLRAELAAARTGTEQATRQTPAGPRKAERARRVVRAPKREPKPVKWW